MTVGADISKVGVALTGAAAIAKASVNPDIPNAETFGADSYKLPEAFKGLGLRKEDGAPEWSNEAEGDPIKFFEDGYEIPTGQVKSTCTMTLAQTSPLVVELMTGRELDEHGVLDVDLGGNAEVYILYTEEVYKSSGGGRLIERRMAEVTVTSVVAQKPERGSVRGYEVTFSNRRSSRFGGAHYRYAQIVVES